MNIKNKQHNFYLDYKYCKILKSLGLPQTLSGAEGHFWFNNDRRVYASDKIIKFPGWEKQYTRAWTDGELNAVLSKVIWSMSYNKKLFTISTPLPGDMGGSGRGIFTSNTEVQCKAMLIKYLVTKNLLKVA